MDQCNQQQQSGWEWQQFDDERRRFEEFELACEYAGQPQAVSQRMLEDFDSVFMVSNGERG
jgi:hypothetical protein